MLPEPAGERGGAAAGGRGGAEPHDTGAGGLAVLTGGCDAGAADAGRRVPADAGERSHQPAHTAHGRRTAHGGITESSRTFCTKSPAVFAIFSQKRSIPSLHIVLKTAKWYKEEVIMCRQGSILPFNVSVG